MGGLHAINFVILAHDIVIDSVLAVDQEVVVAGVCRRRHPNTEDKGTVMVIQERHKVAILCGVPVSLSKMVQITFVYRT